MVRSVLNRFSNHQPIFWDADDGVWSDVVNSEELVHEKLFLFSGMILGAKVGQRYPKVAFLKKIKPRQHIFQGEL